MKWAQINAFIEPGTVSQLSFSFWSSDFPLYALKKSKIEQASQKSIPTLQNLRASLYSLFLMQSRAFFKAVFVSFVAVAILKTFAGLRASGNYDQLLLGSVTRHRMSHREYFPWASYRGGAITSAGNFCAELLLLSLILERTMENPYGTDAFPKRFYFVETSFKQRHYYGRWKRGAPFSWV